MAAIIRAGATGGNSRQGIAGMPQPRYNWKSWTSPPGHLGFAVPLQLRTGGGLLSLITTITSFATAADATVSELRLEAFLPADAPTAAALRDSAKLGP
jgi:hypothetical protein